MYLLLLPGITRGKSSTSGLVRIQGTFSSTVLWLRCQPVSNMCSLWWYLSLSWLAKVLNLIHIYSFSFIQFKTEILSQFALLSPHHSFPLPAFPSQLTRISGALNWLCIQSSWLQRGGIHELWDFSRGNWGLWTFCVHNLWRRCWLALGKKFQLYLVLGLFSLQMGLTWHLWVTAPSSSWFGCLEQKMNWTHQKAQAFIGCGRMIFT